MTEEKKYCDQCDNHCPVDALKCGRGRRAFQPPQESNNHEDEPAVLELLRHCGHMLHHGSIEGADILNALNEEEIKDLERILSKITELGKGKRGGPDHHHGR